MARPARRSLGMRPPGRIAGQAGPPTVGPPGVPQIAGGNDEGPRRGGALRMQMMCLAESAALRDGVLDGPAGELGAPPQPRLLTDPREVVLHRARRDVQ